MIKKKKKSFLKTLIRPKGINEIMEKNDFIPILNCFENKHNRIFNAKKHKHKVKFDKLVEYKSRNQAGCGTGSSKAATTTSEPDKLVINMSSRPLDNAEQAVLSKGLTFGIAPSKVSNIDIVTSVESAASLLPVGVRDTYRCSIVNSLKKPIGIDNNININETKAIKQLRSDDSIVVIPSDKGGAVVVLDRLDYNKKINDLISGGHYNRLKRDPTKTVQNKIKLELKKIKSLVKESTFFRLSPQYSKAPHLYGLPKLHKDGVPLRPIVSAINSPYYELSKFILPILTPLFGSSETCIRNSEEFIDKLRLFPPTLTTIMVSFDVCNLFPNVPIDPCLLVIKNKLENDVTLSERTNIPVSTLMELLNVCIKSNYFQFEDKYYEQTEGMAMGGVLSPILSNLFMEHFEKEAISTFDAKPRLWLRYVDDVFCLWEDSESKLQDFRNHLNVQYDTIKFTVEFEKDNKLPFLDVLVCKQIGCWETSVYKKPTATGRYLRYSSYHPEHVKMGLAVGLIKRAKIICSNDKVFNEELKNIKTSLESSGYPKNVINKAIKKASTLGHIDEQSQTEPIKPITTVTIPYVRNFSEKIRRINAQNNIRTVFRSSGTIRSQVTKVKPVNKEQENMNVIYNIPCSCGLNYIGQTSRPVQVRIMEHWKKVKNKEFYGSKICDHVLDTGHTINWDESTVLYKEPDWRKRNLAESLFMACETNTISRPSVEISPVYVQAVSEEVKRMSNTGRKYLLSVAGNDNTAPPPLPKDGDSSVVVRRSARIYSSRTPSKTENV